MIKKLWIELGLTQLLVATGIIAIMAAITSRALAKKCPECGTEFSKIYTNFEVIYYCGQCGKVLE